MEVALSQLGKELSQLSSRKVIETAGADSGQRQPPAGGGQVIETAGADSRQRQPPAGGGQQRRSELLPDLPQELPAAGAAAGESVAVGGGGRKWRRANSGSAANDIHVGDGVAPDGAAGEPQQELPATDAAVGAGPAAAASGAGRSCSRTSPPELPATDAEAGAGRWRSISTEGAAGG